MILAKAVTVREASVAEVNATVVAVPRGGTTLTFVVVTIVASMVSTRCCLHRIVCLAEPCCRWSIDG